MIRIAFRLDDPSPSSDHALERELLGLLESHRIPLTAAVIPIGRDGTTVNQSNVPHLVAAHAKGLLEVVLHGYKHEVLSTSPTGVTSEFSGVEPGEQLRRIRLGRQLLEAAFLSPVTGFIPPWNTLDDKTLAALAAENFYHVSTSSVAQKLRRPTKLCVYPHTCNISELDAAYAEAKRYGGPESYIVCILHHYDLGSQNHEGNPRLVTLDGLACSLSRLRQDTDVEFTTLGQIAASLGPEQCWKYYRRHYSMARMHWRLRASLPNFQLLIHPLWQYFIRPANHAKA